METMRVDTIYTSPWNVLTQTLPKHPSKLLLVTACLAADYCCHMEGLMRMNGRMTLRPSGIDVPVNENIGDHFELDICLQLAEGTRDIIREAYERAIGWPWHSWTLDMQE